MAAKKSTKTPSLEEWAHLLSLLAIYRAQRQAQRTVPRERVRGVQLTHDALEVAAVYMIPAPDRYAIRRWITERPAKGA